MANVEVYLSSRMTADQILELGADHIAIATGATWRRDGYGRHLTSPVPGTEAAHVLTPDDIMAGKRPPQGRVLIFDDDHYYMGSVLAELLRSEGYAVSLATPVSTISEWTIHTLEQRHVQARLSDMGIELLTNRTLLAVEDGTVRLRDSLTREDMTFAADGVVMVTSRLPEDGLYQELRSRLEADSGPAGPTLHRIGDCDAPGIIATAVYEGHRFAREIGETIDRAAVPFHRERHVIEGAAS
jgi:dimethylamine/trimethylamine dehydrogenase